MKSAVGELPEKVVVTGAGSGIGRATALRLHEGGATVLAVDRSSSSLAELAAQGIAVLTADITVADERARILAAAADADGLVNAAGVMTVSPVEAVDDAQWDALFNVNVKGTFYLARDFGLRMRGGSSIVNVSSLAARVGANAEVVCYAASKAAVLAVTRGLAHAFGARGVRVNAIVPGLIDTPMQDHVIESISRIRGINPATLATSRIEGVPLEHRLGTADECASVIAFLLGKASSYVTGHALSVDGGIFML